LKDRKKTLAIIKKLRKMISLPLSFKTRTGIDEQDTTEQMKFLVEASKYVDMITIHGRTVKQ
jgi:tRNA-dihydrouridine synthase